MSKELYIGTNIFDGRVSQKFYLTEDEPLYRQGFFLHSDIGGVEYVFENGFEFVVDVSWAGDWEMIEDGIFRVRIFEGPKTEGKTFFVEESHDFKGMKASFQKAIDLIQRLKSCSVQEQFDYLEVDW